MMKKTVISSLKAFLVGFYYWGCLSVLEVVDHLTQDLSSTDVIGIHITVTLILASGLLFLVLWMLRRPSS